VQRDECRRDVVARSNGSYVTGYKTSNVSVVYNFRQATKKKSTMTIKGRLRSSIAIVKRFQTERIHPKKVHPSDRLPFPLEFRNHMWC